MSPSSTPPNRIGIAVVDGAGRFLVGVRAAGQPLAGLHEFPGGKCRPGESPRECAVRECLEETGLVVQAVRELHRTTHAYSHAEVELHFWLCRPEPDSQLQTDHNGYVWIAANRLRELRFPEANAAVVEMLAGSGPDGAAGHPEPR